MKFSRNLLSKLIDISKIDDDKLYNTLNDIGLEVESKLNLTIPKGVVIGKILEKTKHPNADKLNVCKVDIGNEVLQIVCGASNVEKSQFVPVATIDTRLDKLVIKKSIIRDIESCGMICSSTELGLPKIDDGIFVLDSSIGEIVLGKELCEYEIFNDSIFEINITPNRGDCLSLIGIAMDLSVVFNLNLKIFKEKEKKNEIAPGIGRILNIQFENNLNSSVCYKVVKLQGLINTASLKLNLAFCDILTNDLLHNIIRFTTYMTGVIINAYKFDTYQDIDDKIILNIKRDENGIESVYFKDNKLSSIGAFANSKYSANENSSLVVFEASFIPSNYISEAIFNNNLKTDEYISYISKRGSSPLLEDGIVFLSYEISSMSNSIIYSSTQQLLQKYPQQRISFKFNDINTIIGNTIKNEDIASILKKMNFTINSAADDSFISAIPPLQRQDITSIQDIAEEILRIKGINSIASIPQNFNHSTNIDINYKIYKIKRNIAQKAIANRFFECIHYVFYQKDILKSYNLPVLEDKLDIKNPITNELNTLRSSLIPAMLDSAVRNINYGYERIALFEIGSIYDELRNESQSLAFVVSEYKDIPQYPKTKGEFWDFYSFTSQISDIIGEFSLKNTINANNLYHKGICSCINKNGVEIGFIGKLNPYIANKLEINSNCFICEIKLEYLLKVLQPPKFKEFSKYQSLSREFSILIDKNISFGQIKEAIFRRNFSYIQSIIPLDIYTNDRFGDKISLSFKIIFQSKDSTLKTEEIQNNEIIEFLKQEFKAILR
ncbi:phenylalanine--tRNA ligase subunit beta [Helicobacter sp. MIT 14-3879]|uniref:phenylalanine--tRNA ligase subunit beta n=1 Tax=Helicobacter sp. MIT 14-3879 TaxID=2040649 RepID=UPI000E1E3B22|nr:phenylalanine--tRNA ligase subunit beta [Helicobacter sp. MIT 14-3879]RDU62896.1 phenylalanine--tRNA ligase subunit beta [Helicobacter sp. MIT 14-3879]